MSKNRLTLVYSILLLSALLLPTFAVTQGEPTAVTTHSLQGDKQQTYIIPWYVLDAGGKVEEATSANYRLKDAIGQPVIGKCENANYRLYVGFCTIATVVPPDPWAEINHELDELIAKVDASTIPPRVKIELFLDLNGAKAKKIKAKIFHHAVGNDRRAKKHLYASWKQVNKFEKEVRKKQEEIPDAAEWLKESGKIKDKINALIATL